MYLKFAINLASEEIREEVRKIAILPVKELSKALKRELKQ